MTIQEAMRNLNFDPDRYLLRLSYLSKSERVLVSRDFLAQAKKRAKSLMLVHHPDKGGSHDEFVKVSASIDTIEKDTLKFIELLQLKIREKESKIDDRVIIERF